MAKHKKVKEAEMISNQRGELTFEGVLWVHGINSFRIDYYVGDEHKSTDYYDPGNRGLKGNG